MSGKEKCNEGQGIDSIDTTNMRLFICLNIRCSGILAFISDTRSDEVWALNVILFVELMLRFSGAGFVVNVNTLTSSIHSYAWTTATSSHRRHKFANEPAV